MSCRVDYSSSFYSGCIGPNRLPGGLVLPVLTPQQREALAKAGSLSLGATYYISGLSSFLEKQGVPLSQEQLKQLTAYTKASSSTSTARTADLAPSPPKVTPAPSYEPTPEQKAWEEFYSTQIKDILEKGGIGIPEETKQAMMQQQFALIRAQEQEAIKQLRSTMERRGITNSLFALAQEQKVRAASLAALSQAVTDINIRDALTKLSSFENALGRAASFLGYLAEESAKKYQPQYQTWVAQQQLVLERYRTQLDTYRAQVEYGLRAQELQLRNQLNQQLLQLEYQFRRELAEMELRAKSNIAAISGFWNLIGTLVGGILGFRFLV